MNPSLSLRIVLLLDECRVNKLYKVCLQIHILERHTFIALLNRRSVKPLKSHRVGKQVRTQLNIKFQCTEHPPLKQLVFSDLQSNFAKLSQTFIDVCPIKKKKAFKVSYTQLSVCFPSLSMIRI